jgi:tetratricopeptide (TPR) repeat protein
MVAQQAREWDQAEKCYKESLKIKERFGEIAGAAGTCNQLAIVGQLAGRPADVERWYRRALEFFVDLRDEGAQAKVLNNLADLLLAQGRLDEAEQFAQRAVAIDETLDLSAEPWKDYSVLANIAQARRRAEEARAWRRKERASFAAFAGADTQIARWQPVIAAVVAGVRGNRDARHQVEQLCAQLAQSADWKNLAAAIQRVLAGERD